MAELIVGGLEDELVRALEERAARHGRSREEEHRAVLRQVLLGSPGDDPKRVLLEMPEVGEDADFDRIRG